MLTSNADRLSPAELSQLMHFYAEAGVDWLLESDPIDRHAEFAAQQTAPAAKVRGAVSKPQQVRNLPQPASSAPLPAAAALPDAEAVVEAKRIADAANSIDELTRAIESFTHCNLRNSARNTAFVAGNPAGGIAVAAGMPSEDDDRDGAPFSGVYGAMLEKMLGGIGLSRDEVMIFNLIPWRPPGNRQPTPHELEICRPFGLRLLDLARPRAVLALGNSAAKYLTGSTETIHALRGRPLQMTVEGRTIAVLATFHPQDLRAAPGNKGLAWRDLLSFKASLTA